MIKLGRVSLLSFCIWTDWFWKIILYGNKIIFITLTNQVGYGSNKGIVPIACNEIFDRISKLKTLNKSFEVSFSIFEIYNEKVQDLTVLPQNRPENGLKVRDISKLI